MAISGDAYDLASNFPNAFKTAYISDKKIDVFAFTHKLLSEINVTENFTGSDEERVRATSHMGGYGFGDTMPRPNESNLIRPKLTAKRFYARALIDTESIAAALDDKGAFFRLVDRVKLDINRAIQQGLSLALLCTNIDHELVLGVGDGSTSVTGSDPYVITLASDTNMYRFHVKQIVNIEDGDTDLFEVTAVDRTAKTITVDRLTGDQVPANTDEIFLQGGDGNAYMGLPGACASSGTLYNVTLSDGGGWMATTDTSGGSLDEHRLYEMALDIENKSGELPNLIVLSLAQWKKLTASLANKRMLMNRSDEMGHRGLVLACDSADIPVIWDRFVKDDESFVLNTNRIELHKRPMSGMASIGGDILLPDLNNDMDRYLMVYRCYGNFFIEPTFQGHFDGLDT